MLAPLECSNKVNVLGLFILVLFLVLFYSFWVLATIAVTKGRISRQKKLAEEGYFGAQYASRVLRQADKYLLVCQIWAFFSAFLVGFFSSKLFSEQLIDQLEKALGLSRYPQELLLMTILIFLLGGIALTFLQIAKAIAFPRPTRTLCRIAIVVILFGKIVSPLVYVLRTIVGGVLKKVGITIPKEKELAISPEELNELVEISSRAGIIEEEEKQMIQHVFAFSETLVREVMTPRADIISIPENATLDEIKNLFDHEKVSRILVTGESLDDVKGVVMAKDLIPFVGASRKTFSLASILRPAFYVSETKHIDALLREFCREGTHYAVVIDEHGGVEGVVTQEDLLEEIVGEIFDEYDSPLDEVDVFKTRTGDLLVDGSIIIDDLNAQHRLSIPTGEYDTLAGFVIHLMGKIPIRGESVEYNGLLLTVEGVEQNRITQVRIKRL